MEEGWGYPGASGAQRRTLANGRGQNPLDLAAREERPKEVIYREISLRWNGDALQVRGIGGSVTTVKFAGGA